MLRVIQRMNPNMRQKQQQSESNSQSASLTGPVTGSNFKQVDPSVKKVLCPALALPNERIERKESDDDDEDNNQNIENVESTSKSRHSKELSSKASTVEKEKKKSNRSRSRSPGTLKRRKNSRSRSRSRDRDRSRRHRSRTRSRSPKRSDRDRDRDRSRDNQYSSHSSSHSSSSFKKPMSLEPIVGEIYDGIVSSIMQFGCFVQLKEFKKKTEGLVHVSNIREQGRVTSAADAVTRHQKCKVKVLSMTGTKISLSMKDVDQASGKDLNPANTKRLKQAADELNNPMASNSSTSAARNPDRPDNYMDVPVVEDDGGGGGGSGSGSKKKVKQISDFEKWELQQLRNANAIQISDLPYFDEETGILQKEDEEDDVDVEIEMVEDECVFLKVNKDFYSLKFILTQIK